MSGLREIRWNGFLCGNMNMEISSKTKRIEMKPFSLMFIYDFHATLNAQDFS